MSDHEEYSVDTGYSTPVPELDDHTHQSSSVQRSASRRGTADTASSAIGKPGASPRLAGMENRLKIVTPEAWEFEEAVSDEEASGMPARSGRAMSGTRSRRGTFNTVDPRSMSPPNSVKAFADARRRERDACQTPEYPPAKESAEARHHDDHRLHRTLSRASGRSRRTRRLTDDRDANSIASSHKSAEEDVCFPLYDETHKEILQIDFDGLEEFIADEEVRDRTPPPNQPHARIFSDLRKNYAVDDLNLPTIVASNGDLVGLSGVSSSATSDQDEKHFDIEAERTFGPRPAQVDNNRFEYFSSLAESTIHAAEFGDLILPGEDIRSLFTFPEGEEHDGAWWLNMNNPTEEEIRAICKAFGVHPLTIEDISTQETREKIELFPSYYFACFRSFHAQDNDEHQRYLPFNIYVVVFREGTLSFSFMPNDHAANVRRRITTLKDYVALSSDWICYALIDHIVDSFKPVIDKLESETDTIDDQVFIARSDDTEPFLRKVGRARKNVMGLMKLLGGKADVLRGFTKRCNENYKVTPRMDIGLYLGDIQDHVVTMMTSLSHFEKMLSRSHTNFLAQLQIDNVNQGNLANKMLNKVTLLASILVPLNLIAGLFGMNVDVPFRPVNNLAPFFSIVGFMILWSVISYMFARRMRYI